MKMTASSFGFTLFLVFTVATIFTAGATVLTGPVTNAANGHVYYLLNQSTWTAAEAEAVSMGGHLATVRNDNENAWIASTFSTYSGLRCLWIGLNDATQEGTFVWSSGETSSYRKWDAPDQPDNAGGIQDYAYIYPPQVGRHEGFWDDDANDTSVGYSGNPDPINVPLHGVVEIIPSAGPVITSFSSNGQLIWTNRPGTNCFTVQWAPAVTGPWSSNWDALQSLVTTNAQTTVAVPMFYRVAEGYSPFAMQGVWLSTGAGSPFNDSYLIAQTDGILSEGAMFNQRAPLGYFQVGNDSRITNTLILVDQTFTFTGRFINADEIQMDLPLASALVRRVKNVSLCQGNWSGTLHQTAPSTADYAISFYVDNRGLATGVNVQSLTGNGIGRFFGLTNSGINSVGFLYTGANNGSYNIISFSGTRDGNNFIGNFSTDVNYSGTLTLTRP